MNERWKQENDNILCMVEETFLSVQAKISGTTVCGHS